ncbi:MAG: hypothetical protein R2789_11700 [Microthrixaceae bacterium]
MVQASVGFHCPQCAGANHQVVSGRAAFGAAADPIATKVLIGANVAVYVLMVALGGRCRPAGRCSRTAPYSVPTSPTASGTAW